MVFNWHVGSPKIDKHRRNSPPVWGYEVLGEGKCSETTSTMIGYLWNTFSSAFRCRNTLSSKSTESCNKSQWKRTWPFTFRWPESLNEHSTESELICMVVMKLFTVFAITALFYGQQAGVGWSQNRFYIITIIFDDLVTNLPMLTQLPCSF